MQLKIIIQLGIITIVSAIFIIHLQTFFEDKAAIPLLIWWTTFIPNFEKTIECKNGEYKCLINSNKSLKNNNISAFLFYGSHIENHDLPVPRNNIPWAIFHEESPKNYAAILYQETQDLFNISSTFSRKSDFPVTLQYLENLSLLTNKRYVLPLKEKNLLLNKLSPILYVQTDCDTPIGRDYLVNELSKYIKIDSYGKCLKNKKFPKEVKEAGSLDLWEENYMHFVAQYKFVISFENAICEDYITEKLWRPLIVGSIPIYLGSPTVEDWLPNEKSAILAKNFSSMKNLAKFIDYVNENDTLYNSFLEHKTHSKISNKFLEKHILDNDPISEFECYVCKKVHQNEFNIRNKKQNIYDCPMPTARKNEENTWDQHWNTGRCQSKALSILISQGKSYSKETFESTWKTLLEQKKC